jgi:hypothetical protein
VLLVLPLLVGFLVGCDTTATQPTSQVAVQAYLQAEAPLDTVRLTRTVGAGDTFDPQAAAVQNADVEVRRLNGNGAVVATTAYSETATPGAYAPVPASPPDADPTTTYQLHVDTDDGTTITSTTTVPDAFSIRTAENTTAEYQNDAQQPSFILQPPRPVSERQNAYVFTVESLLSKNQLAANFTPFYEDQYDADEDSLSSFRLNSSGLLNQGNFTENADGTITVDLPWLGIAFFGLNRVALNVVDDNFYDFLRSQSAQQGSFAPGEIPNVIEHVEGGTGIFGSYARDTVRVDIKRPS